MNNNTGPFISFIWNNHYLYILLYWIIQILIIFLINKFDYYFMLTEGHCENHYINLVCIIIGDLLAGFFVLFTIYSLKEENKEENEAKDKKIKTSNFTDLIYNNIIEVKHNKIKSLLILISVLYLSACSSYFAFHLIIKDKKNEKIELEDYQMDWKIGIDFIVRHLFSRIILKIKFHRHNKLSLIICSFGFLLMTIQDFISFKHDIKNNIILIFIFFELLRVTLFSLSDVLSRVLLIDHYILPQTLMFYRGLIGFCILLIITPILYFTSQLKFSLLKTKLLFRILFKVLYIILTFFKAFCLVKVIFIFTAQYVSFLVVAECFGASIYHFYKYLFFSDDKYKDIMEFIIDIASLIIILFSTLLYNEIIIINRCGLNETTKNALLKNSDQEMNDILNEENDPKRESTFSTIY